MTTPQERILVLAESGDSSLEPTTFELVTIAKRLASQRSSVISAALLGAPGVELQAKELFSRGVATVYLTEHSRLAQHDIQSWSRALGAIVEKAQPTLLLLGHTPLGRDLAPYLALHLGVGVATGCMEVRWNTKAGDLEAVRAVFGGDVRATYSFSSQRPRIITMKPRAVEPAPPMDAPTGNAVAIDSGLDGVTPRVQVIRRQQTTGPRLEDARIVVSGGLGLQSAENYTYIQELAHVLGGMPGASRAIVDLKWVTAAQQVGLTGRVVAPDLYLAVGISGAIQHIAGMSASKVVVAINRDPNAAIFRYAKYGVVADCLQFLPILIEEARRFLPEPRQ